VAIAIMTIVWVCGGCRAEFAELRRVKKHQTMSAPLGGAYRRTGTRHHTVLEPVPSTRHSQHGPMHVQFCMPRKMLRCVRQPLSCRSHTTHPRVCKKPASLLSPCKGRRVPWLSRQALRLPGPARLHRVSAANPVKMFLFIPPWLSIMLEDLDLTNIEHWKYLSWGRMIMPFECAISPTEAMTGETRPYAYIEEYWPYEPLHRDQLCR